ncbi:MAG: hypothetical protein ACLFVU_14665 [Phycisphaerae bacterium]
MSVLRCPSGKLDWGGHGEGTRRYQTGAKVTDSETGSKAYEDLSWYAANGDIDRQTEFPFVVTDHRKPEQLGQYRGNRITEVKNPSRLAAFFDGWWITNNDWQRIAATHFGLTRCNIVMMDGSARAYDHGVLPIGNLRNGGTYNDPALAGGPVWKMDH